MMSHRRRIDRLSRALASSTIDLDPACLDTYLADAGIDAATIATYTDQARSTLAGAGNPQTPTAIATALAATVPGLHAGDLLAEADRIIDRCAPGRARRWRS